MPSAVTRILERCLAKDPDDRYGTAEELLSDLEALAQCEISALAPGNSWCAVALIALRDRRRRSLRIAAGILYVQNNREPLLHQAVGVPTRGNRLAVLPVTLVDSHADEGYLADGLTQELIAQLSKIGGLRVIARSSVMGYRGGIKNPTEIGRELGVETVLHSSVAESGRPAADLHAPR